MIQQMLAFLSPVPMPFLNPACTSGSFWFTYCWSMVWRILSITLLAWVQLFSSLNILWHCLSLWLEWKLTFSSPVATDEFSKFAGILSAALSQHHLSGFEIAQLYSITSTNFVHSDASKAHLTSHSRMSGFRWHPGYRGHKDLFCIVLLCLLATSS